MHFLGIFGEFGCWFFKYPAHGTISACLFASTTERRISVIGWTFEQSERFSELGELAELFESLKVDMDGDGIMDLLVSDLFRGIFDPEDSDAKPSRYARASYEQKQTIAIPSWTLVNRVHLKAGNCLGALNHCYGSSRDVVALLYLAKALPFDAPDQLTPEFVDAATRKLAKHPINKFSAMARNVLDCVMVDRTLLRKWFEDSGVVSPFSEPTLDRTSPHADAANCNVPEPTKPELQEIQPLQPGRPASDLWPRVQDLVIELHAADPETYNNAMASEIHERLGVEFPGQKVLALTTIQGNMKELRENARAILREEKLRNN